MTTIRHINFNIPVADTCTECGQPFNPGDWITLSPPMHRTCDPIGTYIDNAIAQDLETISRQLDQEFNQ